MIRQNHTLHCESRITSHESPSLARGRDEGLEELSLAGVMVDHALGVPLHTHHKRTCGMFNGFDNSVRRARRHHESRCDVLHRLMVKAVYLRRRTAQLRGDLAAALDGDRMRGLPRRGSLILLMRVRGLTQHLQVLMLLAASGDIEG